MSDDIKWKANKIADLIALRLEGYLRSYFPFDSPSGVYTCRWFFFDNRNQRTEDQSAKPTSNAELANGISLVGVHYVINRIIKDSVDFDYDWSFVEEVVTFLRVHPLILWNDTRAEPVIMKVINELGERGKSNARNAL